MIRIATLSNCEVGIFDQFAEHVDKSGADVYVIRYVSIDMLMQDLQVHHFDALLVYADFNFVKSCLSKLGNQEPTLLCIIIGPMPERNMLIDLLKMGISGYILDTTSTKKWLPKIKKILKYGFYISPGILQILVNIIVPKNHPLLSAKEIEVIFALKNGHSYDEIATLLNLSIHTVRTHIRNIYRKLEVHSSTETILKSFV